MISNLPNFTSEVEQDKLIILDRDGTLIENIPYLSKVSLVKFNSGVIEGLKLAQENNFKFVIATNQSGIGRGLVTLDQVNAIHDYIKLYMLDFGIQMSEYILCPHLPEDYCKCRKPKNGMIEEIITRKKIDRTKVFLIGDSESDAIASDVSGIKSFIINNQTKNIDKQPKNLNYVNDFLTAINTIVNLSNISKL